MSSKKEKTYHLQASIPLVLRYLGLLGGVVALIALGLGFYLSASKKEFRGKEFPAELSGNVIGIINGYQRNESENGIPKYYIEADEAKTFDDEHQEFKAVKIQLFKNGDREIFDRISADKAVYIPVKDSKEFTIFFAGNVDIRTNDRLLIKTDQLSYRSIPKIALAEELVEFSRDNISGTSFGASVNTERETLTLQRDVNILVAGNSGPETVKLDLVQGKLKSGTAFLDSTNEKIRLTEGVDIKLFPEAGSRLKQPTNIASRTANVYFVEKKIKKVELDKDVVVKQIATKKNPNWMTTSSGRAVAYFNGELEQLELFDRVSILTKRGNGAPVRINADRANYTRTNDTFVFDGQFHLLTKRDSSPVDAIADRGVYKQGEGELTLEGGAKVSQGSDLIKGDTIFGKLSNTKALTFVKSEGHAYLKQDAKNQVTEVDSRTLSARFTGEQRLKTAEARGVTVINAFPADQKQFAHFKMSTPKGLDIDFNSNGFAKELITLGRTTLHLDAGKAGSAASDKTLTADKIRTEFMPEGNDLSEAHAIGNAVLLVIPKSEQAGRYNTRIESPRFDCEFFKGNNAKRCVSSKRSELVRTPVSGTKPDRKLNSDQLVSTFDRKTREISVFEALGSSKFSEGKRNGTAEKIVYRPSEFVVKLSGGRPTIWDTRARARAKYIEWNTDEDKSVLMGNVSTTYYNQKQTGGATPFSKKTSPVFLTASTAHFDHQKRTAVYLGNARAWQSKNYVRGEKIVIEEKKGTFFAEGKVESVLYRASRTIAGRKSRLPVFVSAGSLFYLKDGNLLRYEKNVDIRQGTDRIVANSADVFLEANNSLSKTIVRDNVVITQPNRRATGDYAQYDAVDETVLIKGNPARFSDSESGTTTGKTVNVDLKTRRVVNSGSSTKNGSGRIRSVYKVKKGRLN